MLPLLFTAYLAGFTVVLGALLALYFQHHVHSDIRRELIAHTVEAFGGGIMLAAVALVLIPKGMHALSIWAVLLTFIAGVISFALIDQFIKKHGGKLGNLIAMTLDFVPESIALGALFVVEPKTATLLAIFIGLQNFPESFTAFRELVQSGFSAKKSLIMLTLLSFSGVVGAFIGLYFLQDKPEINGMLMIFSSAGILFLLFQDIVPEIHLNKTSLPSMAASFGFLVGIMGEMALH